ncbi:hypothetical protein ERHG_04961 [Escherichia coli TA007]|nr:hypothetical protein ERHG_04961 [Escherichia coli TA007]
MRRLNKIVDNTGGLLDEAKQAKKRAGPGDIIFKNLPEALAVRGEWKEERFNRAASLLPGSVSEPPVRLPQVPSVQCAFVATAASATACQCFAADIHHGERVAGREAGGVRE